MRKLWVFLLVGGLFAGLFPAPAAMAASDCTEMSAYQAEFKEAVARLDGADVRRLISDPAASHIQPGPEPLTRAHFARVLAELVEQKEPLQAAEAGASLPDMADHWGASFVAALAREGIVRGYPDGRFHPNQMVSLPEVKLMLARWLQQGPDLTLAEADSALQQAGVRTDVPCPESDFANEWQIVLLVDRALAASANDEQPAAAEPDRLVITAKPGDFPNCPDPKRLAKPDPTDGDRLTALLPEIIPLLYTGPEQRNYKVSRVQMAADAGVRGEHVKVWCGPEAFAGAWVVGLTFPDLGWSASLSSGLFYVAKEQNQWNVWYRYK